MDVIKFCKTCQGFVRRGKRSRGHHLAYQEKSGVYTVPWWVSVSWLEEYGCHRRDFGEVPIPFVWMRDANEFPELDLATCGQIDGEPRSYELEWFS